jgi:hypothetical protein
MKLLAKQCALGSCQAVYDRDDGNLLIVACKASMVDEAKLVAEGKIGPGEQAFIVDRDLLIEALVASLSRRTEA